ncbi:hypothetical protein WA026_018161 [Henosepilachna vigintioctopunctata]|uniref:Girdin n=1 Tax=Henosepilachna vigintioctopunctata TaxID=420089 RepID=A0AAW1ULI3_9CUCU
MKLKETVEFKDVALDQHIEKASALEKEVQSLTKENSELIVQLEKLQEFEKKTQELLCQVTIHTETISTLQKDLILEKVNNEKFKTNIEKLGLNSDTLENDINVILEKMLDNSDILKTISTILKDKDGDPLDVDKQLEEMASSLTDEWRQQVEKLEAEITSLQLLNENMQTENASLQVDISTLKSQIQSLQTQQTALQLANSQLVAEKDDLSRQNLVQKNQHDTLLFDQVTLRTIHEQLSLEYEEIQKEQENLKKTARDLKLDVRTWKEKASSLENIVTSLEHEKEAMKADSRNLTNLRTEHSKLKDDFRNLFAASERLKMEYKSVQEELKILRSDSRNFRLSQTEMQGELNSKSDMITGFQLENAKLQQKCDMLYEMNASLDSDRRALMEHVSQLLAQYHSLFTHSIQDKEQFHLEEKMFTDKLNNLCRQKEKLEEKIMEHYKRLDNATSKKGGFATLVRRVRKAGSDIMNKVPRSNRRSWQETPTKQAQPQVPLNGSGESNNGSNGNDSDNSMDDSTGHRIDPFRRTPSGSLHGHRPRDEVALRRSHRDMAAHRNSIASEQLLLRDTQSALSLGSIGSRRTVYISEDEPNSSPPPSVLPLQTTPVRDNNPPLLVYNRISTVIGDSLRTLGNQTNLPESPIKENGDRKKTVNPKETAVWYEYGCV